MQDRFETFTVLVAAINRCIYKIKTEEMAEFDLKSSHVSCLYYLYKQGPLSAKELCDLCGEDKANISRTVRYLESSGYVACKAQGGKRYQSALILTKQGEDIAFRITHKVDDYLAMASQGLDEQDRLVMYRSLALIAQNLEQICQEYACK